jgi:hypothetical protein
MTTFQITHLAERTHELYWQMPVSQRIHNIGVITHSRLENIAYIRIDFIYFLTSATMELADVCNVDSAKVSGERFTSWVHAVLRNDVTKIYDFKTVLHQWQGMVEFLKPGLSYSSQYLQYIDALADVVMNFLLHWNDSANPLVVKKHIQKKAA